MMPPSIQPVAADVSRTVAQSGIAGAVAADKVARERALRLKAEQKNAEAGDKVELLASPQDAPDAAVEEANASAEVSPDLRDESVATPTRVDLRA